MVPLNNSTLLITGPQTCLFDCRANANVCENPRLSDAVFSPWSGKIYGCGIQPGAIYQCGPNLEVEELLDLQLGLNRDSIVYIYFPNNQVDPSLSRGMS